MRLYNIQKGVTAVAKVAAVTSGLGLCLALQAQAQDANPTAETRSEYIGNDGGSHRINVSGKFRAMSQRIPVVACVLINTHDTETMMPRLIGAVAKFDEILNALRVGDPKMQIFGVETDRRILKSLDELEVQWAPFRDAAEKIIAGEEVEESFAYIVGNHSALLEAAKEASYRVGTKYANPVEITASEALLINFSGRQRMLSQRIAMQSCGIEIGNDALGNLTDLGKSASTFEATYLALRDGMTDAGIEPAPTDEIRAGLDAALNEWLEIKELVARISGKDTAGGGTILELFRRLEAQRKRMVKITTLYSEYAKTH